MWYTMYTSVSSSKFNGFCMYMGWTNIQLQEAFIQSFVGFLTQCILIISTSIKEMSTVQWFVLTVTVLHVSHALECVSRPKL